MDGAHLNLAGYRCMARAVLDAMGDSDVLAPTELHVSLLPGVIRDLIGERVTVVSKG